MTKHLNSILLALLVTLPCSRAQPSSIAFSIERQPAALSAQSGEVAIFEVRATGEVAVAYDWWKDGTPLANSERISGARTPRLSLCPVTPADAGQYSVHLSDGTNTVVSDAVPLFVDVTLPTFTNAPLDVSVNAGEDAVFSADATGTPPIVYRWRRDGEAVTDGGRFSGATTPTLTIVDAQPEDIGWYSLTASNADGTVSSEPARLTVHASSSLASAAGFDACVWTTGGSAEWHAQSSVSRDGNGLSHDTISDYGISYLETTVYGPGTIEFSWKVSSEGADPLHFRVDGNSWARISGEVEWTNRVFHIRSGPHVVRWEYKKDGSIARGADHGFVDQISFTPISQVSLETALDAPPLPIITYGAGSWFGQETTSHDGVSAARSGYVTDNQTSTIEATVSGPGWIDFTWQASSEGADPLIFAVDGHNWTSIAGEDTVWTNRAFHIPWGIHTLTWTYDKDYSIARGSDAVWLDAVSYTPVDLFDLAEASDWAATPWTSGGDGPWFGQDEYSSDGVDAMQSTPISDSQSAWVDTELDGPGTLLFKWKVSAEGSDRLQFLVDSNRWNHISGEVDWVSVTNVIRPGTHHCRWEYTKDYSIARGLDAGWVDEVHFTPAPPLPEALNAPSLTWTTDGDAAWFPEMVTQHDGVAAVRSGDISHNQATTIETTVNGPGQGSFFWKVSSEGADRLRFLIDGNEATRISGDVDWTQETFAVPSGTHTLTWRYQKDYSVNLGQDAAWLDRFTFGQTAILTSEPAMEGHTFTVTLPSSMAGSTYALEFKHNLDDPAWTPLPPVSGTGFPLVLRDDVMSEAHRFYRVRME